MKNARLLPLVLGIVIEWEFAPFRADASFGYFLANLDDLRGVTQIMIILGAVFGFWLAVGREPYRPSEPAVGE